MKQTPKSCSCRVCRRGKGCKAGNLRMRDAENSFRMRWRSQYRFQEDPLIAAAPNGSYMG